MKTSQRQTARAKADAKWQHLDPRRQEQDAQAAMDAAWAQLERERQQQQERQQ
jgi:ribosome-associated translation inhibitor RaiA